MSQGSSNAEDGKERRTLLWSVLIITGMVSVPFVVEYRDYFHAAAWHVLHGNDAVVGEHRVRLPLLWWQTDSDRWHTSILQRAWRARRLTPPTIEIAPISKGVVGNTDTEQLQSTQSLVAIKTQTAQSLGGPVKEDNSLLILKAEPFSLYCIQSVSSILRTEIMRTTDCSAAKIPYAFNYWAPLYSKKSEADALAKEADAILTSLQ